MKSYRKELWFDTKNRRELINITGTIEKCLKESGIKEGLLLCNAMHITASVFINDDEPGLHNDFEVWLEGLAPEKPHSRYKHNSYEDNADAHLKRTIMGREVVVAITEGTSEKPLLSSPRAPGGDPINLKFGISLASRSGDLEFKGFQFTIRNKFYIIISTETFS